MRLKRENKPWREISGHYRQMLPPKPRVAQDLELTHTQAQLLAHAKYENHHTISQQKDPLTGHCYTGTTQQTRTCNCRKKPECSLKANTFKQMCFIK